MKVPLPITLLTTLIAGILFGKWLPNSETKVPLAAEEHKIALATKPSDRQSDLATKPNSATGLAAILAWPGMNREARATELRRILRIPDTQLRLTEFMVRLKDFSEDDILAAVESIKQGDKLGISYDREWGLLVKHWGRTHNLEELENLKATFRLEQATPETLDWFTKEAIHGVASRDVNAAVAWLNANPTHSDWLGCLHSIAETVAKNDAHAAAKFLTENLTNDSSSKSQWVRQAALATAIAQVTSSGGPAGLKDWYSSIPTLTDNGETKREAFNQITSRLKHAGKQELRSFLTTEASTPWRNDSIYKQHVSDWAQTTPGEALAWYSNIGPSLNTNDWPGATKIFKNWLQRDPGAAQAWLNTQPPSTFRSQITN